MEHFRFFEISLNIAKTGVVLAIISQFFLLIHKIYDLAEIFWPLKCVWRHNGRVSQCLIFFHFRSWKSVFLLLWPLFVKEMAQNMHNSVILLSVAISTIYFWLWPVVLKISVIFWIFRPFAMYLKIAKVWKKSQLYQFLVQLGQNRLQKRIQHQKTRFPGIFQVFSGTIRWVMTSLRVFGVSGWPKLIAYPENWKTHKKS